MLQAVFLAYSSAMIGVQMFEARLADLLLRIEVRNGDLAHVDEALGRMSELARKKSAGWLHARVGPHLEDKTLLAALGPAIKWRNRLAHRYLREKLAARRLAEPATAAELSDLARRYLRLVERLSTETARLFPPPEVVLPTSPEFEAAVSTAVDQILTGGEAGLPADGIEVVFPDNGPDEAA